MSLQKPLIDIVIIPISNPLLVGIYENSLLIDTIQQEGMTSEVLPMIFDELLKKYNIKNVFYVNGPGSFMAIKLAYIFLKTLQITKSINIFAQDGFYFNNNSSIKAIGKMYFNKENDKIILSKNKIDGEFQLPKKLNKQDFTDNIEPLYIIEAV